MNEPLPYPGIRWGRIALVAGAALVVSLLLSLLCTSHAQTPTPPAPRNYERAHHWLANHNPYSDGVYSLAALLDSVETESRVDERARVLVRFTECVKAIEDDEAGR